MESLISDIRDSNFSKLESILLFTAATSDAVAAIRLYAVVKGIVLLSTMESRTL